MLGVKIDHDGPQTEPSWTAQDELQALIEEARRRTRRRRTRLTVLLAAVALPGGALYATLAGSSQRPTTQGGRGAVTSARLGRLDGLLAVCCNAHGMSRVPGVVVLRRLGGGSRRITVAHDGDFSVDLLPGSYLSAGGIPTLGWKLGQCRPIRAPSTSPPPTPIVIRSGATTRASIVCAGW